MYPPPDTVDNESTRDGQPLQANAWRIPRLNVVLRMPPPEGQAPIHRRPTFRQVRPF